VERLATATGRSISATIAELVSRGLDALPPDAPPTDPRTGFPVFSFGTSLTVEQISQLIEED
jgi:hypothetical protein